MRQLFSVQSIVLFFSTLEIPMPTTSLTISRLVRGNINFFNVFAGPRPTNRRRQVLFIGSRVATCEKRRWMINRLRSVTEMFGRSSLAERGAGPWVWISRSRLRPARSVGTVGAAGLARTERERRTGHRVSFCRRRLGPVFGFSFFDYRRISRFAHTAPTSCRWGANLFFIFTFNSQF